MGDVEVGDQLRVGLGLAAAEQAAVELIGDTRALQEREADGHVARPLGDLLLADGALLLPFLDLGDHHGEQLHDDRAGDVRHHAEGEDRHLGERPAREEVEEPEHAAALGVGLQLLDRLEADAGHGDVRAQPVEGDHGQREDDLVPKVGDLEHVLQAGEHRGSPSGL